MRETSQFFYILQCTSNVAIFPAKGMLQLEHYETVKKEMKSNTHSLTLLQLL